LGNIFMVFGMVSWSLVGAQGRYKLATIISAIMSFCVTLPLAAIFCIVYEFTLEGLTASVVIGYSTTGMVLAYVLLTSDWEKLSKTIREHNEAEGVSLSDSRAVDSDNEEGLKCKVTAEFFIDETECELLDGLSDSDSVSFSSFLNNEYGSPVSISASQRSGSIKSKDVVYDLPDDISLTGSLRSSSSPQINRDTNDDISKSMTENSKTESFLDTSIDCGSLSSSQRSLRTLVSNLADCSALDNLSTSDSVSFSSFLNECGSWVSLSASQRGGRTKSKGVLHDLSDEISLTGSLCSSSSSQRNRDTNSDISKSMMENSKTESLLDRAKHNNTSNDCVSSSSSQKSVGKLEEN